MAVVKELPATLMQAKSFSRKEYINAMMACYNMTEAQIVYDLQKRVKEGTLLRTGWGQYALQEKKILYTSQYSKAALQVVSTITDLYDDIVFQVFELVQLNTFMNHLFAHNTIFVYVEKNLVNIKDQSHFSQNSIIRNLADHQCNKSFMASDQRIRCHKDRACDHDAQRHDVDP